jgi:uncharacterized membrane protein YdfJ with MMPL/SSD domain
VVSLSLDYNLFALSHVKRALGAGATMADAVEGALRSPGHQRTAEYRYLRAEWERSA